MFHHLASRGAWGCFLRRPPQEEDRVHTIKRVSIERLSKAIWEDHCKPLRVGKVVVMYNLSAHKGQRVRKLIEDSGCELLYLPPYSPALNPIEEAFSKVKGLLRVIGARTKEVLVEAIGKALDAVAPRDARASSLAAATTD